jgi:hypothetical protein
LFGFNVQGEGGSGDVRSCKIIGVEGEMLKAEGLETEPGNKSWLKIKNKVG